MAANSDVTSASTQTGTDPVIQINIPVSTKLDRQNFLTWRSQIEPIIDRFGISQYLDPLFTPPAQQIKVGEVLTSNPAFLTWYRQDRLLLGWLRSSITGPVLSRYVAWHSSGHISIVSTRQSLLLER